MVIDPRSPRHLVVLFLGTTFVLLASLGWLGWRSLQRDRAVEVQVVRDRLESATDLIAAQIRQNLSDLEEPLSRLSLLPVEELDEAASSYAEQLGKNALVVVFEAQRVRAYPRGRLLYYPVLPVPSELPDERFADGEAMEFKDRNFSGAIAYFQGLTRANEPVIRAGALLRLARNQRKAGDHHAALTTYTDLARVSGVFIAGWPADLRARKTRCDVLEQLRRISELKEEALKLERDLYAGQWPLPRSTFMYMTAELQRWLGADRPPLESSGAALAHSLAASVDALWERWQDRSGRNLLANQGSLVSRDRPEFLLWRGTATRLVALVSGPGFVDHHVVGPLQALLQRQGVGLFLADGEGQAVVASRVTAGSSQTQSVVRTMADTRLPWTLRVVSADPEADFARLAARRRLLIGALGFMVLLAVAGGYFSLRAMTREIQAARLQSEFVAAVSHEFRTPLTSLRQFTDLLADGRVSNEADRENYYAALRRGTRRLTTLVENLLDFGRMEAGFYRFSLQPVRAKTLVERVTGEFGDEARERGYTINVTWDRNEVLIHADEAALGRALWNLLDNAVKYSPDCKTIWVEGATVDDGFRVSVRDRGLGVPAQEHKAIFRKFFRGSIPDGSAVKGTGLGLALVDQIVQAHGGRVTVQSTVGQGSTFSIVIPALQELPRDARLSVSEAQS